MKKCLLSVLICFCLASFCIAAYACVQDNSPPDDNNNSEIQQLTSPTVSVSQDGTITWSKVPNANRYVIYVNGTEVFTTSGFSYLYNQTNKGTYDIQVVATDYLKKYADSQPSNTATYVISRQKLDAPNLVFDGEKLYFNNVANATDYDIYVDKVLTECALETEANVRQVDLSTLSSGFHTVEVRALGDDADYIASDISRLKEVVIADKSSKWNADTIMSDWYRNTDIAITKPNGYEVMFWVDSDAYKNSYIENYVEIPSDAKSLVLSCFASPALENAVIDLQIRSFDGAYQHATIQGDSSLLLDSDTYDKYYFVLPSRFAGTKAFVKITVNTSGTYQTQAVIKDISFSQDVEFVRPEAPLNTPVRIRSVSQNKYLRYDEGKGYMVLANSADEGAAFIFETAGLTNGQFRIKTQNGMYLTRTMLLTEGNVAWDYIIQTPRTEGLLTQVWSARYSEGSDKSFTLINHGCPYDDNGTTKYMVLNAYYPQLDNVCMWQDIVAQDLQFEIEHTTATFSQTPSFIQSPSVDFTKPVFAYFTGRNKSLVINNGNMVLGGLISDTVNLEKHAWVFESAEDGYYYVKNENGKYLFAEKNGANYFILESDTKKENGSTLFKVISRGGNMFYMGNKFVDDDSRVNQYMVYDVISQKIAFYTDLVSNADQILRLVNVGG